MICSTAFANEQVVRSADVYFKKAMDSTQTSEKLNYFQKAYDRYYMETQLEPSDVYSYVQIARIYSDQNRPEIARNYFATALGIEPDNPFTNYHIGNFCYKQKKYKLALEFYNKAYGIDDKSDLYINMALIYEKFGDLLKANTYYKKAYVLQPSNNELADKIREIDSLKYKNTGYYNKKRK
ncbi:tetratricopeptide repeat protein [bacterium]|nr:tetratricopeptide repeat protein [bacterium]